MKMRTIQFAAVVTFLFLQAARADVVITPFQIDQLDSATSKTVNDLFFESYQSFVKGEIKRPDSARPCQDKLAALDAAKRVGGSEAVYGVGHKLGEKWIVSAWRLNTADGATLASARLDSKSIEDFEFVMKRLAESLAKGKKVDETATIDNVTEGEMSDNQFRRREGFYAFGVKVGYLFPPAPSHSYQDYNNTYSATMISPSQIVTTDWINWFELPRDLALEWDLHAGWEYEFGTNFDLIKLFSRGDFAPFAGGGIGIDWVIPNSTDDTLGHRNSGFSINGRGGIMLFRTYSFRILASAGYKVVLNSDYDQAVTADIGIIWKKQKSSEGSSSPLVKGLAIIGGIVVGLVVLGAALQ
jgi:hypothetical protein